MTSSFDRGNFSFNFLPVKDFLVGDVKPALMALLIAVTRVLLSPPSMLQTHARPLRITSEGNFYSHCAGRESWPNHQAVLTESLLLAILGGLFGVLWRALGRVSVFKFAPENLPRVDQIQDRWVCALVDRVGFSSNGPGLRVGACVAELPSNLNEVLRDGGRSTTESAGRRRGAQHSVCCELAAGGAGYWSRAAG